MQCPKLGIVPPSVLYDLVIKASPTGITFLQQRRYRQRYTGNKKNAVDINGNLWLQGNELQQSIKADKEKKDGKGKKKGAVKNNTPEKIIFAIDGAISEEKTENSDFARNVAKKVRKKCYSINKREVRQRLLGYINTQRGKKELYFFTVTFPVNTSDDVCYQAYNTWLTSLRKYGMLRDYLWVAERQDGKRADGRPPTNTIHYHIAVPHYMNVQRANAMMRGTLKNLAKAGSIPYNPHQPQIAKYNGVDIAKNRKTGRVVNFAVKKGSRALATYLTKYVTKNDAGVPNEKGEIEIPGFDHLAWHNSRGYSSLFTAVTFTIQEFKDLKFGPFLNRVRVFEMNFAKFIPWLYGPPPLLTDHLYKLNSYIQHVTDNGQSAN